MADSVERNIPPSSNQRGYTSTASDGPPQLTAADVAAMQVVIDRLWGNKQRARIDALVDRFLAWPLPKSVCSDLSVTDRDCKFQRIGTNLLTADEARAMLEYVLSAERPADETTASRGKPCTCEDTSESACGVNNGARLGELWYCRRAAVKASDG